jgi:hypothetical protein
MTKGRKIQLAVLAALTAATVTLVAAPAADARARRIEQRGADVTGTVYREPLKRPADGRAVRIQALRIRLVESLRRAYLR